MNKKCEKFFDQEWIKPLLISKSKNDKTSEIVEFKNMNNLIVDGELEIRVTKLNTNNDQNYNVNKQ